MSDIAVREAAERLLRNQRESFEYPPGAGHYDDTADLELVCGTVLRQSAQPAATDGAETVKNLPPGLDQVPGKMGGRICIKGHRFTAAVLIADLAEMSIDEFCADFQTISRDEVIAALKGVAILLDEQDERTRQPAATEPLATAASDDARSGTTEGDAPLAGGLKPTLECVNRTSR